MLSAGRSASRLWLIPSLLAAAVVAVPLVAVCLALFAPGSEGWSHILSTVLVDYVLNTLALMVLTGVLALVPGVGCAWLVASCEFPGRRYFDWMLVLPLAAPAYVLAYAYTDLLEVSGPLQSGIRQALGLGIDEFAIGGIRSLPGAAAMLALVLYPYIYLLTRTSFATRSGAQFEAARVLGMSPGRAFWRVALPPARPAIAGGLALVLMETLADFRRGGLLRRVHLQHRDLPDLVGPGRQDGGHEAGRGDAAVCRAAGVLRGGHPQGPPGRAGPPPAAHAEPGAADAPCWPAWPAPCPCCWDSCCPWAYCCPTSCNPGATSCWGVALSTTRLTAPAFRWPRR